MPALPETAVLQHRARRIVTWRPGHAPARMRARAAQVQALERHPVIGCTDHRPRAEQLVEAHLAMEDVAADQPEAALEIERRMDLPADHRRGKAGGMRIDGGNDRVGRLLALVVPTPPRTQVVAEVLAEERSDMLALGREAGVE